MPRKGALKMEGGPPVKAGQTRKTKATGTERCVKRRKKKHHVSYTEINESELTE